MIDLLGQIPKVKEEKNGWPWNISSELQSFSRKYSWPKITIITPSFNQGHFIEETIRSVLLQNYPNLEYIIIDGGSSDNTLQIIKKYEKWISYWVSEKDKGQSDAINKGLRRSSGVIVNWLNSDDYYEQNALLKIAQAFNKKKTKVVAANSRIFSNKKSKISLGSPYENDYTIFSKARIDQPATFFSKSVFDEIGELDSSFHLAMDLDLWVRFLLKFGNTNIQNINNVVVNFREHGESKTIQNQDRMIIERFNILDEVEKSLVNKKLKFRYSSISINNPKRKNEIIKGIQDFKMFWIKHFLKNSPCYAKFLSSRVNPLLLKNKDLIDYIIIKSKFLITIK